MFDIINKFEEKISEFYNAPYAVSTDCCTHAIELCLRYTNSNNLKIPRHTYLSIPMTAIKLNLSWEWKLDKWEDYYCIGNTNIYDAAVLWRKNSYIAGTFMCLSFQYKKHLNLGRGGMILTDDKTAYNDLIKLGYDGRHRNDIWANQEINSLGYHYYMTPETAKLGLEKFEQVKDVEPKKWTWDVYPDISKFSVFN